jgi:uncharacterized membrane-anchored protein
MPVFVYERIGARRFAVRRIINALLLCAVLCGGVSFAADDPKPSGSGIEWHQGPYTAMLGDIAQIDVPAGFMFADAAGTRRLMELTHNPSSNSELGVVIPVDKTGPNSGWFLLFEFNEIGHVSDSDKSLDADKIFTNLGKNTEDANQFRKEKGWAGFHLERWAKPPFYDETTHNLTWATLGKSDDPKEGETVNYSTRILGRRGAMSVDLVIDPTQMDVALPASQQVLRNFSFRQGNRYAEFVKGDKVATYGLAALIAGGAAAAVVKTGLLTKLLAALAAFWKLIAVGIAAVGTWIKRFFQNLKSKVTGERPASEIEAERKAIEASSISSDHDHS